jgi:pimeloyl-ACP methyl ester carboxylesterase
MVGVLNAGMLALMTSIGHRAALFDTMASLPPATSPQIAEAAGLDERYVREWLAAMTTGGIVEHDPEAMTFVLPMERAAWLTRAAGPENLALQAQYVGLLAQVEDQVVDCFRPLLYGDADERSPLNVAEALHAAIPMSTLVVMRGLGHESYLESASAFNGEVRRFLRAVDV